MTILWVSSFSSLESAVLASAVRVVPLTVGAVSRKEETRLVSASQLSAAVARSSRGMRGALRAMLGRRAAMRAVVMEYCILNVGLQ